MKSKKPILILLVGITILIGGMYMRNFFTGEEITQEMMIQEEQERMAEYIIAHYENIKKIEFLNFKNNKITGSWYSDVIINKDYKMIIIVTDFNGEITTAQAGNSNGKFLKKKLNVSKHAEKSSVDIIYCETEKSDDK